jgi:hypothetical protein
MGLVQYLVPTDSRCSPPWFRWQELRAEAFRTGARKGDWMMALKLHWDSKLIRRYPNQKLAHLTLLWHTFDINYILQGSTRWVSLFLDHPFIGESLDLHGSTDLSAPWRERQGELQWRRGTWTAWFVWPKPTPGLSWDTTWLGWHMDVATYSMEKSPRSLEDIHVHTCYQIDHLQ